MAVARCWCEEERPLFFAPPPGYRHGAPFFSRGGRSPLEARDGFDEIIDALFDQVVFVGFAILQLLIQVGELLLHIVDLHLADLLAEVELRGDQVGELRREQAAVAGGEIGSLDFLGELQRLVSELEILQAKLVERVIALAEVFEFVHGIRGTVDHFFEGFGIVVLEGFRLAVGVGLGDAEEFHDAARSVPACAVRAFWRRRVGWRARWQARSLRFFPVQRGAAAIGKSIAKQPQTSNRVGLR